MHLLFQINTISTPPIVGNTLFDAVQILSDCNLNIRIIGQKEDPDLPNGTIINQRPSAQQKIRPNQTLFCMVSYTSAEKKAPNVLLKDQKTVEEELKMLNVKQRAYKIPSHHPADICIGQMPTENNKISENTITTYISQATSKPVIIPIFKNHTVSAVTTFLQQHSITPIVTHNQATEKNHTCINCIVLQQKPLAGSLAPMDGTTSIQLYAQKL